MLELCVLAVLRKEDSYGYQIIKDVSDLIEISESTLYPILRRLEMGGKVKSYTTQYNNRLRKYFHLTEEGRQYLKNFDKDRAQLLKYWIILQRRMRNEEGTVYQESSIQSEKIKKG